MASRTGWSPSTRRATSVSEGMFSFEDFLEHVLGGGGGIGSVADRPAHDQHARPGEDGVTRCPDALLVISTGAACGANAGGYQDEFGAECRAQAGDLGGRANQAANP